MTFHNISDIASIDTAAAGSGKVRSLNIKNTSGFVSTRNACKLCTPLGACMAFKGVEGAVSLLHGSQGCATYIRRYMISHFKEPIDIASSNFSEETAVFGGGDNLALALDNIISQYNPKIIGIATTCLSETIGDDVSGFLRQYRQGRADRKLPKLVQVSTASYSGTHSDGYIGTLRALVEELADGATSGSGKKSAHINVLPPMLSPADLRNLKELFADFDLDAVLLPDYSDTLDGPAWDDYQIISPGGTSVDDIARMGSASATIEMAFTPKLGAGAGHLLNEKFGIINYRLGLPVGVRQSDIFFATLEKLSGRVTPSRYLRQRGRLLDSFVDAHKYVFGKRAIIYGEEDLVVALAAMLSEVGIKPVLCASGGKSGRLAECIETVAPEIAAEIEIMHEADFMDIDEKADQLKPDILIGNSKGYKLARRLNIPLVRVGFPIHDRIGGARIEHLCYSGTQQLFDRITNALLEVKQASSSVGYTYL